VGGPSTTDDSTPRLDSRDLPAWLVREAALDDLERAAVAAGLLHALDWWRIQDILHHVDRTRSLADMAARDALTWPPARRVA
jgi:hypothetical protein